MAPAPTIIDLCANAAFDVAYSAQNVIGKQQRQQRQQQQRPLNEEALLKTPISYCLLRGMSNSIGGGIGKSVRAVLSAFSNLESEQSDRSDRSEGPNL